jgi:ABC-type Fe3+ transport system permease subunit
MMTAEAWDFALSQPTPTIVILAVAAIVLTTAFISRRQQLFVRRKRRRLTEQRVVTNLTVSAVVLCGMLTMFAIMFGSIFVIGELLFSKNLVAEWAHSVRGLQGDQRTVNWTHYVRFAGIASSLSIVIGALGASFEEQHHFRHITFVDEEV